METANSIGSLQCTDGTTRGAYRYMDRLTVGLVHTALFPCDFNNKICPLVRHNQFAILQDEHSNGCQNDTKRQEHQNMNFITKL